MAEDVREQISQTVATDATTEVAANAPEVVAAPDTVPEAAKANIAVETQDGPEIGAKAEPVIEIQADAAREADSEPASESTPEPAIEAPADSKAETKMPPAPQLDAPTSPAPPIFLREHEQRARTRRPIPPKASTVKPSKVPIEPRPKFRFPLLAATLALSAGLGAAAGAVGVPLAVPLASGPATAAAPAPSSDASVEVQAIRSQIAQLTTDVAALRTTIEQSGKPTPQVGKLAERLDRIERAQAEPAQKLTKIAEAIDRLERRTAALGPAAAAAGDITGTIPKPAPAAETKPKLPIIDDYVVRKVFDGVALVEGRRGIIEIEPGMSLPGAGRIEEIRRQDGRWVVVTSKGLILSR
jgi:hypothetical protein